MAAVPANRHGNTHGAHDWHDGRDWHDAHDSYRDPYDVRRAPSPTPTPSPLRQGAIARQEQWVDRTWSDSMVRAQQGSQPSQPTPVPYLSPNQQPRVQHASQSPQRSPHAPGSYLSPMSGPYGSPYTPPGVYPTGMGAFGAPAGPSMPMPPLVALSQEERAQYLVLKEFYEIVTGPEKGGERARRLRAIAGAVGLPVSENPLTASQPTLDPDAALHRWLRWVRYCRQSGDVEPFFQLIRGALYGDAFWFAREEGERVCARALAILYERYGAAGQRPDPRARPFAFSDRTLVQTVASVMGVRWAPASLEYQHETAERLKHVAAQQQVRPPLVALVITPTPAPTQDDRGMTPPQGTIPSAPRPLLGPCILVLSTDPAYERALNWDFACMLGYLALLRPFFVGVGTPGDYKWLPHPVEDTSITPHLHQFALALTSEEACPAELRCECARVAWTLNQPPPLHTQASDALDVRSVEAYEAAHGITRPRTPVPSVPRPPLRSVPRLPAEPLPGVTASRGQGRDQGRDQGREPMPFAQWPDGQTADTGADAHKDDDGEEVWDDARDGVPGHAAIVDAIIEPTPPPHLRTVISVHREREARVTAVSAATTDALTPAPEHASDDEDGASEMATWSGNAADLIDPDLLDTGALRVVDPAATKPGMVAVSDVAISDVAISDVAVIAGMSSGSRPNAAAARIADEVEPTDEWESQRYVTPVLPVARPHRSKKGRLS